MADGRVEHEARRWCWRRFKGRSAANSDSSGEKKCRDMQTSDCGKATTHKDGCGVEISKEMLQDKRMETRQPQHKFWRHVAMASGCEAAR